MRIAVLSDIHGNLAALEAVEQDFRLRGVDQVVNLGDHVSGPLLPRETADFLMRRDWIHLAGNHERQLLDLSGTGPGASDAWARANLDPVHLAWLSTLLPVRRIGDGILACHGTPRRDREHLLFTVTAEGIGPAGGPEVQERRQEWPCALLLCGHTHVQRCLDLPAGTRVVNPGSVGLQAYVDEDPMPYRVENGTPEARYAVVEGRHGTWTVDMVQVAYDVEPMVELARARGFSLWEEALRSGRLPACMPPGA